MKKIILFAVLMMVVLPSVLAINLQIKKTSSNEVLVKDLNKPAIFSLEITNLGASDNFQFYNLLGLSMAPKGNIYIGSGETKNVSMMIYPDPDLKENGFYTFQYFIKGSDSQSAESLTVKIAELGDAFEIGSGEVYPDSNSIDIYIQNNINFDFGNLSAEFTSPFFDVEKNLSLKPYGKESFRVQINSEDFKKLVAAFYTMSAKINVDGKSASVDGIIKYAEKNIVTTTSDSYGFIVNKHVIEKKNEGNVVAKSDTVVKKNIISRLFTSFNPQPDSIERQGVYVYYTWNKNINPGETLEITASTNWLFPVLIIFFIIAIVFLAKQYSKTNVVLTKRVSFVRAKGAEFALKVTIFVSAQDAVERVNVIDRLPPLVKVHERFGGETPTRINEKNRRIEWNFEHLDKGEKRVLSYIIYSKVGVMGKFALPQATAVYERNGEIREAESNTAYFVAEQRKGELED